MVYQEASLLLRRAFTLLVILLALVIVVESIPIVHDHLADGMTRASPDVLVTLGVTLALF